MPKMPISEPILTIFCHFDGLQSTENLGGIAYFLIFFSSKYEKNNISSARMRGTPCHHYKSNPLKCIAIVRGVIKTQILPKICCQILHLCISYSKKNWFHTLCNGKIKVQAIFYYGLTHLRVLYRALNPLSLRFSKPSFSPRLIW